MHLQDVFTVFLSKRTWKKLWCFLGNYPLVSLLLCSWLVLSVLGSFFLRTGPSTNAQRIKNLFIGEEIYASAAFNGPVHLEKKPVDAIRKSRLLPYMLDASYDRHQLGESEPLEDTIIEAVLAEEPEPIPVFQWIPREPIVPRSQFYDDVGATALDTYAPYVTVEDSYFDDACIIGDSRVEGMAIICDIPGLDFYYQRGERITALLEKGVQYVHENDYVDSHAVLTEYLRDHAYKKIYLCTGVNDLGFVNADVYLTQYMDLLSAVQESCPDALIFICSIMYVATSYSDYGQYSYFSNNDNINARNFRLAQLADGETIFYIDANVLFGDDTGGLDPQYTNDGIHLRGECYKMFSDFLRTHGILKEEKDQP